MSAAASLGKLQAPLRDLVIGATEDGSQDFGKSEKEKADIAEWIDKVAQGEVTRVENLKVSTLIPAVVGPISQSLLRHRRNWMRNLYLAPM